YRDAAAWRFLGVPNPAILADDAGVTLLDEPALFDAIAQRESLEPELREVQRIEREWRGVLFPPSPPPAAPPPRTSPWSRGGEGSGGFSEPRTQRSGVSGSSFPLTPSLSPTGANESAALPHSDRGGEGVQGLPSPRASAGESLTRLGGKLLAAQALLLST